MLFIGRFTNPEKDLVTLAKIPVCPVSEVFVWSRRITFIRTPREIGSLVPGDYNRLFIGLNFRKLITALL